MTDLLFVGRPAREKGLADLLLALENVPFPWRLHVAGDACIADADSSRIRAYGALRNSAVAELMRRVDVVVVPSRYENFGNVALEAMAAGRIVIAARTGGMADLIQDGVTGVHFPPGDVDALARQLVHVMSSLPSLHSMGLAARRAALSYAWPEVSRATALLLRRFL